MSKFTDAVALAKAGFKATEIKQMLEEKENEPEPQREENKETPEEKTDPAGGSPEPASPAGDPEPDEPENNPEPDYKKLYEDSQKQLKKAQETNIRGNAANPNEKTLEEQVQEILGGFIGG